MTRQDAGPINPGSSKPYFTISEGWGTGWQAGPAIPLYFDPVNGYVKVPDEKNPAGAMMPDDVKKLAEDIQSAYLYNAVTMYESRRCTWAEAMQFAAVELAKAMAIKQQEMAALVRRQQLPIGEMKMYAWQPNRPGPSSWYVMAESKAQAAAAVAAEIKSSGYDGDTWPHEYSLWTCGPGEVLSDENS